MTKDFAYNCDPCKRKKKRCDRIQPCSNCVLYSCQSECYSTLTQARTFDSSAGINDFHQQRPLRAHTYADDRQQRRSVSPLERHRKDRYSQDRYSDSISSTSSKPLEKSKTDKNTIPSNLAFSLPALDMCFAFLNFAGTVSRLRYSLGLIMDALSLYRYLTKAPSWTLIHCKSMQ